MNFSICTTNCKNNLQYRFFLFFFRERQSPKEVAKKSDQKSPNILEKSTPKSSSLDSEFDLLSLSKPNNTPSAKTTVVQEPAKSSAVTDLLGLGGKPICQKYSHFFYFSYKERCAFVFLVTPIGSFL